MPKAFPSAGRSTAAGERPCDIVHTTDRDQAIDFAHPDVAWTGSTHSCRLAVLCMRNVSVSSINDRVQMHMRAMPHPPMQNTCRGETVMGTQKNSTNRTRTAQEPRSSSCEQEWPLHTLKFWEGAVCMLMRNLNGDLKDGTRLIVDRVSARSVRAVEPLVYKGPG